MNGCKTCGKSVCNPEKWPRPGGGAYSIGHGEEGNKFCGACTKKARERIEGKNFAELSEEALKVPKNYSGEYKPEREAKRRADNREGYNRKARDRGSRYIRSTTKGVIQTSRVGRKYSE